MKNIVLFFTIILISPSYSDSTQDYMSKLRQERMKMKEQILKMFNNGMSMGDFFDSDSISSFDNLRSSSSVIVNEEVNSDGSIDIIIKPKSKDTNLEVDVSDKAIIIKSESRVEEKTENGSGTFSSFSSSSFSQSIPIPAGYFASKPDYSGDGVKIVLKNSQTAKSKSIKGNTSRDMGLVPIGKEPGEETL